MPFPLDLSGYRDASPEEVAPLLEKSVGAADERAIPAVTALLMNRLVRLLRQGPRQEILDESLMLNRFLAVEGGRRLRQSRPEAYGGWSVLGELLSGAARSTGRSAVPSLLRGTQGRGLAVLELLAAEGRALRRAEVRQRLGFQEAQLSHLLRDLEEADLIVRYRRQKSKEVLVELGPAGREVVSESILPPWLERLEEAIKDAAVGGTLEPEALAQELASAGAPSRLAADRLARAVAQFSTAKTAVPPTWKEAVVAEEGAPASAVRFVGSVEKLREGGVLDFKERSDELRERRGQRRQTAAWAKRAA